MYEYQPARLNTTRGYYKEGIGSNGRASRNSLADVGTKVLYFTKDYGASSCFYFYISRFYWLLCYQSLLFNVSELSMYFLSRIQCY